MARLTPPNPNNNSLFVLNGGPGESGLGLISIVDQLIPAEYGITLIFPDHRGTGFSNPLGCDDNNSQNLTLDCIKYLTNRWTIEGLNQFSTTSASVDLAIQIQASKLNGRISILAVSYGTYWLNRFLTIYPKLVQSAIMDCPLNPILHGFSMYNIRASTVATQFLSHCHYQAECINYFPNDSPIIMLQKTLDDIDSNSQPCINKYFKKYSLTSRQLKSSFFSLVQSAANYYDRSIIPAIIYRLNRCNKGDVDALDFFFNVQVLPASSSTDSSSTSGPNDPVLISDALYYNIGFSELWFYFNQSDVDQQTLNIMQKAAIMAPDLRSDLIALRNAWPKYPLDEYRYMLANSSILMISAQLDAATPLDFSSHLASLTRRTRTFYTVPLSGHIIQLYLAITGYKCPLHLILSWAFPSLFPKKWKNPKCLRDLPTMIDFVGETEMVQMSSMKLLNISRPFESFNQARSIHNSSFYYLVLLFLCLLFYFMNQVNFI